MKDKEAYIYALSAVFLWSTVATAFKISLNYLSPVQLLLVASGTSFIVLSLVIKLQKKSFHFDRAQFKKMAILGALNPFLYYLVLFKAYDLLPAQEAQPLNYTWALVLAYLSALILKQRLYWQDIAAGFICYFGVLIISTKGAVFSLEFSNPVGVALALGSTLLWSLFWIYNKKWEIDPVIGLWVNFGVGFFLTLIWAFLNGHLNVFPIKGLLGGVYVGIFEMGFTFLLWLKAMQLTKQTAKIANLIFLSPFLSLFFISIFLKESIFPSTIVGLILIVLGLLLQQKKSKHETAS
ncbi:MAG: DMT family transporter [Sulfurospirillaceae bacterium]